MIDRTRTGAYCQALACAVRPGDVVVDLGAGTGIFTLHACRLGARLVHAIEPNDVIQVAREVVHANGFSERVTFHQAMSFQIELPEPGDVLVTDPRGVVPLFEKAMPTIIDARRRLLRPGAIVKVRISQADTIGKFTRFRIRRGKVPRRTDRCLMPGSTRPIQCPPV